MSLNKLGDVEVSAGNLDQARALFDRSLALREKLAEADPENASWQRVLIASLMRLALIDAAAGRVVEARGRVVAARDVLGRFDAAGLLRGDALLERLRAYVDKVEAALSAGP